jgi:hypothetical protein
MFDRAAVRMRKKESRVQEGRILFHKTSRKPDDLRQKKIEN